MWLLLGGGVLYLVSKSKKAAAAVPAGLATLSTQQDAIAKAVAQALGFPSASRLIVDIESAKGPVTVVDRKNNAPVVLSYKSPTGLLKEIQDGRLDDFYADPFGSQSLSNKGWISSGPIQL
jgi:hypothetical protein